MVTWAKSWQALLSDALLLEIYKQPGCYPFTLLPPEVIQHIALFAFPGNPYCNHDTIADMIYFSNFSTVDATIRRALRGDKGFSEGYYKYMLNAQLALGWPKAMRMDGVDWEMLARIIIKDFEDDSIKSPLDQGCRSEEYDPGKMLTPKMLLKQGGGDCGIESLGPLPDNWEPFVFDKILTPEEAQGKLISIYKPHITTPRPLIYPRSMRYSHEPTTPSKPTRIDISIGMTYASGPPMTRMSLYVMMMGVELGEFEVGNEGGVTIMDIDDALSDFLDQPLTLTLRTAIQNFCHHIDLSPAKALNIRAVVEQFCDMFPMMLPCVMSGKSGILFLPRGVMG